ncbi:AMP-binding protein [Zavarzinia sp. CC-PAN008]|uniref:AMP-binding protein n=1 Tax=Zavarzinia sp. CC-PAN008 TaxID=3243332 RepID=UPI003F748334
MHPGIHAKANPQKPAYIMAGSGTVVTYGELDAQSNRIAHLFRKLGLRHEDSVAIFLENHPLYLQIAWGAHRAGQVYTAISSRLTQAEAEYIVNDCGAKVFIASKATAEVAQKLVAACPNVVKFLMLDDVAPGFESFEEALEGLPTTPIADELEGGDMLYSSGTTGRPKGVKIPLKHEPLGTPNSLFNLSVALYKMDESVIYLSPAPLYHAAPLRFNMTVMRMGGTSIIMEHFDAEQYLALVERYKVTHSQLVPTMFVRMLKLPEAVRAKYDLSTLRVAIHAAAPCPIPVKEQMIAWWGPIILEYYAGTEGNGFCAITSEEWLTHKGSVGRSFMGELHILDDDGTEQPTGEPGGIYFANGNAFAYHNDPEKTKSSQNAQGWSTLGDIGYVDAEGYLYLTDRKANMIISGGVNIYPQEAENLLVTHPKVQDVAVFGVPNEDFGEEVKAVVQPVDMAEAGPALAEELIAFCRSQLSPIKCPRSIDFEAELPRHPTGKLYKRLLKDRYWAGHKNRLL